MKTPNVNATIAHINALSTDRSRRGFERDTHKFFMGYKVICPSYSSQAYELLEVRIFKFGSRVKWVAWLYVDGKSIYREGIADHSGNVLSKIASDMFGFDDGLLHGDQVYMEAVIIPAIRSYIDPETIVMWTVSKA